jgi:hypothetical protein
MISGIEAPSLRLNRSYTLAGRFASGYSTIDRALKRWKKTPPRHPRGQREEVKLTASLPLVRCGKDVDAAALARVASIHDSIGVAMLPPKALPDDVEALKAALIVAQ